MINRMYLKKASFLPGIYIFKSAMGEVLYVGKAKNLKERLSYYFQKELLFGKTKLLMNDAKKLEMKETISEADALVLEAHYIKKFRPKYNQILKDDKNYIYVRVGTEKYDFPEVSFVRKKEDSSDAYFGPYPMGSSIRKVLKVVRRLFKFRDCSKSKFLRQQNTGRPCLFYDLGLCTAPCVSYVDSATYKRSIRLFKSFLADGSTIIEAKLKKRMGNFSKHLDFELAQQTKEKLQVIEQLRQIKFSPNDYSQNPNLIQDTVSGELDDLIEFYNQTSNVKSLSKKQNFRIEAYDVSNISGKKATASMVVFTNGQANKSEYRKFKITSNRPNDPGMLFEAINRRLRHLDWKMPDLLIVDGGFGQVKAARKALGKNTNIAAMGIAKSLERPIIESKYYRLPKNSPALNLIKKVRDEAHRFAKSYHSLLRLKELIKK